MRMRKLRSIWRVAPPSNRRATARRKAMDTTRPSVSTNSGPSSAVQMPAAMSLAARNPAAVETTLSQLPERTQEILVAIRVEGSSLKSLANQYNISTSAIEKHVTKAAKALSLVRRSDLVAANRNGVSPQRQKLLSGSI